ncbi:Chemotaxis response regulator protein-glutamate methylesterase [anaerobic digester metagenome]|jgi:DNA-binding response OmpR family regulator
MECSGAITNIKKMTRVLYIDDEKTLLTLTQIYLKEEANLDVEIADSADEGLTRLRSEQFDAIISDYDMPDMDGIELLKCVRSENPSIPFIIFTGKGREEVVIEALNNGADFYLQKGGDPKPLFTELAHAVRHLVRRSKAEDSAIQNEKNWTLTRSAIASYIADIESSTKALRDLHTDHPDTQDQIRKILDRTNRILGELEPKPHITEK